MTDASHSDSDRGERGEEPGKTRTWWHPLLARLLNHALADAYSVLEELLVGRMPLRVDILLIHRGEGQLSEVGQRDLSVLVPLLRRFTLIEFKAPTDRLESGDVAQLGGCSLLWHSQQREEILQDDVSLIILAPSVNDAFRTDLRRLGCQASPVQEGVIRIAGLPFPGWLVETDVMARLGQPILSLVSRVFLRERERIIQELSRRGHARLLHYMLQQVRQFRKRGEEFAMHHRDTQYLEAVDKELLTALLEEIPAEEILEHLTPEERLRGLSPDERLQGLTEEELKRLRELLERNSGK